MANTIVLQSHTQPLPTSWLSNCIDSVKYWAASKQYDYEFINDELFNYLSEEVLEKTKKQKVIATDLARLKLLQNYLAKGYQAVIWCDADFLIFSPENFTLPDTSYAVGREVWIQPNEKDPRKLTAKIKVHNAFLMFQNNNSFLDFYAESAEKLILRNSGSMPPQYIGPKFLTAMHNIIQCPVLETAGMLSPPVISDIAKDHGPALTLFQQKSTEEIYAANLCQSLYMTGKVNSQELNQCIHTLLDNNKLPSLS